MPSPAPLGPQILDNYMKTQAVQNLVPDFFRSVIPTYSASYGQARAPTAPVQPQTSSAPAPTAPVEPSGAGPSPIGPISPQGQAALIAGLLGRAGSPMTFFDRQRLSSGKVDPVEYLRQLFGETPIATQRGGLPPQIQAPFAAAQRQFSANPLIAQIANLLQLVGRPSQRAKPNPSSRP